jgi:feruloyl esterase
MRDPHLRAPAGLGLSLVLLVAAGVARAQERIALSEETCTSDALSAPIAPAQIGEPVSAVVVDSAVWAEAAERTPAHCMINGRLEPVDQSSTARPIRFGVALPELWNRRSIQMGGGGMNGSIPGLAGGFGGPSNLANGFAAYGSDSGHGNGDDEWALNDEAIKNLGYMQMKKTHDLAMVLIERAYSERPAFNYYVGGSQGGREGLTVAQRYPEDYDGVLSTVPIVGFSSLMLGPTSIRIQERRLENWVPPSKGNAILAEFMRQCDGLDALVDGVINNYFDCRAIFNINDGLGELDPWARIRCPQDVDPDPQDSSAGACLTSGQVETVELVFSDRAPGIELANGRTTFGMWAPSTAVGNSASPPGGRGAIGGPAPAGSLFAAQRFRGQDGASENAPVFATLGSIGVIGFMMQDLEANPLDFDIEKYRERRELVSQWLDSTDPDLSAFLDLGGKLVVAVGTDDTIAPSGEQLNYYQTVIDFMGRDTVDEFARFYVLPQTGHGLTGRSASINGDGESIEPTQIPSGFDRFALLQNWVEDGVAPGKSEIVTGAAGGGPMCSYPEYPRYVGGDPSDAGSYGCAMPSWATE